MPLFEYQCNVCGHSSEILVFGKADEPEYNVCSSRNTTKKMSAHSSMSGSVKSKIAGLGDTGCCGSTPGRQMGVAVR